MRKVAWGIFIAGITVIVVVVIAKIHDRGYILPKCHGVLICSHPTPTNSAPTAHFTTSCKDGRCTDQK